MYCKPVYSSLILFFDRPGPGRSKNKTRICAVFTTEMPPPWPSVLRHSPSPTLTFWTVRNRLPLSHRKHCGMPRHPSKCNVPVTLWKHQKHTQFIQNFDTYTFFPSVFRNDVHAFFQQNFHPSSLNPRTPHSMINCQKNNGIFHKKLFQKFDFEIPFPNNIFVLSLKGGRG